MKADLDELTHHLGTYGDNFSFKYSINENELFRRYYEMVLRWNSRLHLTTLISPLDFAQRFILEAAFSIRFLSPTVDNIWDIGSGGGFPGIPFAILRPENKIYLVEASKNKAIFLKELVADLGLGNVSVINQRFQCIKSINSNSCLTTRALEKLGPLLPDLIVAFPLASQFLFFGTEDLIKTIPQHTNYQWSYTASKIPLSEKRQVISLVRFT